MKMRWTLAFALSLLVGAGTVQASGYQIDPVHTSVVFKVKHLGTSNFYGRFNQIEGSLDFDPASPDASSIQFTIAAESVDTNSDGRDKHLRSPDFFSAKEFPQIRFESTSIEKVGDDTFRVTGNLEMRGVTKTITAEAVHTGSGKHPRSGKALIGFETRLNLKRTDYGVNYMPPDGIGDDVEVIVAVEAIAE